MHRFPYSTYRINFFLATSLLDTDNYNIWLSIAFSSLLMTESFIEQCQVYAFKKNLLGNGGKQKQNQHNFRIKC